MLKYEINENTAEIKTNSLHRDKLQAGCTYDADWFGGFLNATPSFIASFDTLEEAQAELAKYSTSVRYFANAVPYYLVTEYSIDKCEYEYIDDTWVWTTANTIQYTEMPKE